MSTATAGLMSSTDSVVMPRAYPDVSNPSSAVQNLGTSWNGQTMSRVLCANTTKSPMSTCCLESGTMTCSKCYLVKYCGSECQVQHWKMHKKDCKHPYNDPSWQPAWMTEKRDPAFVTDNGPPGTLFRTFGIQNYLWGNVPAINCLQLARNEGHRAASMDLTFCFAASGDIRNVILTVNDLSDNYTGKCNILCNDINGVVVNRNLVILFVLLTAGADVSEAAELAVHLMYSAALTPAMASYVRQCTEVIYGTHGPYSGVWDTRGAGKLRSLQWMSHIQLALRMFRSQYNLTAALANMRSVMCSPVRVDYRDRYLAYLEPNHRLAFSRFRTTGVLAPFAADISHFTEPNRLLFSPEGEWLTMDDANPLFGWDLGPVFECGQRHGATRGNAFGCLFFYLKEQFQKFAMRAKDFRLDLTLSQADAKELSLAMANGSVQYFQKARFDRIETSNLADYLGASQVIKDWAPLLNKANPHSVLLMNFMNWILRQPHSRARDHGRNMDMKLIEQSAAILGFSPRQVLAERMYSSKMVSAIECMEAFYDNDHPFSEFLKTTGALQAAISTGVRLRPIHRIHPKRSGLALETPNQTIPNLTKTEFYDLFLLGGVNYSDRYVEVEGWP